MSTSAGEGTGALEKALDVLDAIGAAPEGLGQSALA
ncbi:MAG: IclR family transcriptional regulator, partial [Rhodoferax sp.]|nr:IclR family transcriptional regulator [Rhodoferax sp.]